ncbi:MAG: nucleoside triphosphate pyrophosphohydrolase [Candidatus Saccharicenans sp.]
MKKSSRCGLLFQELVSIIGRLRSPSGCPWDKARTKADILNYFLEEVYEAVEAIKGRNQEAAKEELGDVLMEVVFLARFYEEAGQFSLTDVLEGINRKMKERHPHVFGEKKAYTSQEITEYWLKHKQMEKRRQSILDGLPASAPALIYAYLLGQRAASQGFDWPEALAALKKVKEETRELEESLKKKHHQQIAEELGDAFFSLVNVCRLTGVNPEIVLRQANKKFEKRFRLLERELKKDGKKMGECSMEELDRIWERIKKENQGRRKAGKSSLRNKSLRR